MGLVTLPRRPRGGIAGSSTPSLRYDAFISYSHALDGSLAPAIQKCLHQLARPWHRPRALHVFRDKTGLPLTDNLWMEIEKALEQSRYFILLASPPAAGSRWVARELAWWKERHGPRDILIVLTDGEIAWDNRRADFDWDRASALPAQMAGWFTTEPLWVDLRWARKENLSVRHSRFRREIAVLAAPVHNTSPEELENEDIRRHRKVRLLTRAATAALATLLALALVGGLTALTQWRHAVRQTNLATAQGLVNLADNLQATDLRTALKLDLAAATISGRAGAADRISAVLANSHLRATLPKATTDSPTVALSADGRTALASGGENTAIMWDVADPAHPARRATLAGHTDLVEAVALSADGRIALTGSRDQTAIVWDVTDPARPAPRATLTGGPDDGGPVALSADGRTALTGSGENTAIMWDVTDPAHPARRAIFTGHTNVVDAVALSADGRTALTGSDRTAIVWDVARPALPVRRGSLTGDGGLAAVALSADGRTALTGGYDNTAIMWDVADPARPARRATLTGHTDFVTAVALSADGHTALTGSRDQTAIVWDVADPARHPHRAHRHWGVQRIRGGIVRRWAHRDDCLRRHGDAVEPEPDRGRPHRPRRLCVCGGIVRRRAHRPDRQRWRQERRDPVGRDRPGPSDAPGHPFRPRQHRGQQSR